MPAHSSFEALSVAPETAVCQDTNRTVQKLNPETWLSYTVLSNGTSCFKMLSHGHLQLTRSCACTALHSTNPKMKEWLSCAALSCTRYGSRR